MDQNLLHRTGAGKPVSRTACAKIDEDKPAGQFGLRVKSTDYYLDCVHDLFNENFSEEVRVAVVLQLRDEIDAIYGTTEHHVVERAAHSLIKLLNRRKHPC